MPAPNPEAVPAPALEVSDNCRQCGAPLKERFFVTSVRCDFCTQEAPNPRPLPEGHEVMVVKLVGSRIGTVTSCRGPKAIQVQFGEKIEALPYDVLLPVSADPALLVPGTEVFANVVFWERATLVGKEGVRYRVKHPNSGFQDSFFDRFVEAPAIRALVLAEHRSPARSWWKRLSAFDLFGGVFKLVCYGFFALFLCAFVLIALVLLGVLK
ncbi:MAG: hypothetical protein ACYC8T_19060 [Myxococcaceae bacterium]